MNKFKSLTLVMLLLCCGATAVAQTRRSMAIDDLTPWQRITQTVLSDNGKWVAAKVSPWDGDQSVYVYSKADGKELASFTPAGKFAFSQSSKYLVLENTVPVAVSDSLKLAKVKDDDMPQGKLVIYSVGGKQDVIDSLRSYHLSEAADYVAYQRGGKKDSTLYVRPLGGGKVQAYASVTDYDFAPKAAVLYFVAAGDEPGIYVVNVKDGKATRVKEGWGEYKHATLDEQGRNLAFLFGEDKKTTYRDMMLYLSKDGGQAQSVATKGNSSLPAGWVVSENGPVRFSKSGARLYFGTSPEPLQKDTTQLDENRPNVQVWSWNEPVQYPVQSYNRKNDLKKTYSAMLAIATGSIWQLHDDSLKQLMTDPDGDGDYALASTSEPYSLSSMWEGRTRSDYYAVDLNTGRRTQIASGDYARFRLSPATRFAYYYEESDSCWYTIEMANGTKHRITTPATLQAWDTDNDVPDYPSAYGTAGWTDGDSKILLYDRYDIWQVCPMAKAAPVNLTVNGAEQKIQYRLVTLDPDRRSIDPKGTQLLRGFNDVTYGYGYYKAVLGKAAAPQQLIAGNWQLNTIVKAKDTDDIVYTVETYEQYPDLMGSDLSFKKSNGITDFGSQQDRYLWGTAELIEWTAYDGTKVQGVVYKPEGFDPSKKYPVVVNFYERNATTLYSYRMPEPHRSTIDYHTYNSNGYIVFNPDIHYKDGHPGESCYNCVMSGLDALIAKGYVDEKHIGGCGHSWGGYQTAYLATRTDRFAALESGAPVVNMFSAYGGIRWWSGMARAFQYEHGQSRIGKSIWEAPELYKENSSLFNIDKVKTPILIMHNDEDGHVPWYQGIEFFVAMKRNGKTCWMLNYTGEPHWPQKYPNKVDFQKRMMQFFNHYLKGAPAPAWMTDGVPAVKQPYELGY